MKVLKNMYNEYHVPLATCTKREQRVNYQIKKLLRKIKIYTKINNNDICDKKKKNKVLITIITVIIIVKSLKKQRIFYRTYELVWFVI